MGYGENAKRVFLNCDDWAKSRRSKRGFGEMPRTEKKMEVSQGECETTECRWEQMNDSRHSQQEKGKTEAIYKLPQTPALLSASAWCTEGKYMGRCRGTFDMCIEIEHRMKKEEMKEQFNK